MLDISPSKSTIIVNFYSLHNKDDNNNDVVGNIKDLVIVGSDIYNINQSIHYIKTSLKSLVNRGANGSIGGTNMQWIETDSPQQHIRITVQTKCIVLCLLLLYQYIDRYFNHTVYFKNNEQDRIDEQQVIRYNCDSKTFLSFHSLKSYHHDQEHSWDRYLVDESLQLPNRYCL